MCHSHSNNEGFNQKIYLNHSYRNDMCVINIDENDTNKFDSAFEINHFLRNIASRQEDYNGEMSSSKIGFDKKQLFKNVAWHQKDEDGGVPSSSSSPVPGCMSKNKHKSVYTILWVIVNVLCALGSYIYIRNAYDNWQSSPVVQALSNSQVHVEDISFPAITLCWPNNLNQDYNITRYVSQCLNCGKHGCNSNNINCNNEELDMLALAYQLCAKYASDSQFMRDINDNVPRAIGRNEFDMYMKRLQPPCESHMLTMQWYDDLQIKTNYTRCNSDIFQQFYSNYVNSLCITYNGLKHEDIYRENVVTPLKLDRQFHDKMPDSNLRWSYDTMMRFEGGRNTVPIYGLGAIIIKTQRQKGNHETFCKPNLGNYIASVRIHSPNEIPFDASIDYAIHENMFTLMMIEPKITLAREDLAQYPPHQRGCFFAHENKLVLFKYYTKKNCEYECLANSYLNVCGCLPYNFPRHNDSVKVCLWPCPRPTQYRCECLPDCNSLTYGITTQSVAVDADSGLQDSLEVFIMEKTFYTTFRYSITSQAEFLAYSLGILGTFLGLSITCLWQLFYFGAARLWKNAKSYWRKGITPAS